MNSYLHVAGHVPAEAAEPQVYPQHRGGRPQGRAAGGQRRGQQGAQVSTRIFPVTGGQKRALQRLQVSVRISLAAGGQL